MDLRGSVKRHLFCLGKGWLWRSAVTFSPQCLSYWEQCSLFQEGPGFQTHSHMWKLLETKEHFKLYRCNEQWQPESKRAEVASRLGKRKETGRSRFDRQAECGRYSAASSSGAKGCVQTPLNPKNPKKCFLLRQPIKLTSSASHSLDVGLNVGLNCVFFGEFVCWSFFRGSFKNVAMLCSLVGTMNLVKPFRPTKGFLLWWLIKERDLCHWVLRDCFLKFSACLFRL